MRSSWPQGAIVLRPGVLVWQSVVKPTAISLDYRVEISYRPGRHPCVVVLDPLEGRPGENLPHVYRDGSLCLYEAGQWTADMYIARTIVPWASEWLVHYELWLASGIWYGDEDEP